MNQFIHESTQQLAAAIQNKMEPQVKAAAANGKPSAAKGKSAAACLPHSHATYVSRVDTHNSVH